MFKQVKEKGAERVQSSYRQLKQWRALKELVDEVGEEEWAIAEGISSERWIITSLTKRGIPGRLHFTQGAIMDNTNITGDVYMEEASITSDDVVRAGGFGARDDIGSFLPIAIDSTDFEASLCDARDYEEPQEQINRPGLGWTGAMEFEQR
ncbi:hypothetical protein Sjap_002276 [Stephania japonica]|uniref:Uncharacterized protein n=1 Tax=Stephania japonica TaxID=461633 RepID=A0AAP0PVZ0_9MAGN